MRDKERKLRWKSSPKREKGSILVAEESYFDDIIIIIIMVNALWASFVIIFPKDSKNLTRKFL